MLGEAHVSRRRAGQPVGDGAAWSADRLQAWRLRDGELVRRAAASSIPRAGPRDAALSSSSVHTDGGLGAPDTAPPEPMSLDEAAALAAGLGLPVPLSTTGDALVEPFKPFDDVLAAALTDGTIRLLDASMLRAGELAALACRQGLEGLEAPARAAAFLPMDAAADALRAGDRRVCFLAHSWASASHPDPDGETLAALLRYLRHPLGAHVVGVFVDFACLHQQPPRADVRGRADRWARQGGLSALVCYAMLCYAMLCCAMLCHAMLR